MPKKQKEKLQNNLNGESIPQEWAEWAAADFVFSPESAAPAPVRASAASAASPAPVRASAPAPVRVRAPVRARASARASAPAPAPTTSSNKLSGLTQQIRNLTLNPSFPLVGLQNPNGKGDNKCFLNASLQLLYAIPELHEELSKLTPDAISRLKPAKMVNYNTGKITNKNVSDSCTPLGKDQISALKAILEGMRSNKEVLDTEKVKVNHNNVYNLVLALNSDFQPHRQADASTVVTSFLQLFNPYINCQGFDELTRKIFIDKTKIYVKLRSDPSRFVPLRDNEEVPILQLQITDPRKATDINELLQDYESPQDLNESNGRLNRFPGNLMIQQKTTIKLHDDQRVLIIQLKRFEYNQATGESSKLRNVVVPNEKITLDNKNFILQGCIVHQGGRLSTGHYVYLSFIDGKINQVINDEKISKESYYINMLNTDGYLFLYKRINSLSQPVVNVPSNHTSSTEPIIAPKYSMTLRSSASAPKPPKPASAPKPASTSKPNTSNNAAIAQLIRNGKTLNEAMNIIRANNADIAQLMGTGKTVEQAKKIIQSRRKKKGGGRTHPYRKTKKRF